MTWRRISTGARWLTASATLLLLCCTTTRAPSSSAALKQIADAYWNHRLVEDVGLQIKFGIPTEHLPDPGYAHATSEVQFARVQLQRLDKLDTAGLSEDERITRSLLQWQNELTVEGLQHFWLRSFITPYATSIRTVDEVFTAEKLTPAARLRLLDEYVRYIDGLASAVREQRSRGILIPKPELPLVRGMIARIIAAPEQSLFRGDDDSAAVKDAIANRVNPALRRLGDVLSDEYAQQAPSGVGLSQYPGGAEAYRYFIKEQTSLTLSPEEIHQLGLRELERINRELDDVRKQVGFDGTLADFRRFLKTDPRFHAKSPEEIGERLMTYVRRIEPQIPRFFARAPRAKYDVKRLHPALEGSMTFGYYQQPRANDAIGHYFYNGSKPGERNLLFAPALMLHELIPGHYFQIARQEENEALPAFRRQSFDNAYVEGWGEYSAAIGTEMGMYADPYDHAGRLVMDSLLSVRLVVDTGMNALGWSRERAMQYMRDNTFQSETEIATETLRYSVDIPAQALAYKLGSLKILELRRKAEQQLGPRFDIRQFHEWIVGSGSMPLTVLEQHVNERVVTASSAGAPPSHVSDAEHEEPAGTCSVAVRPSSRW